MKARVVNSGQSCIAAKRFIVAESVADDFERGFTDRMRALTVGDPLDPATDVGPLATRTVLTDLDDQVRRSIAAGARVLTGGHVLDRPGNYYAPTVLADVGPARRRTPKSCSGRSPLCSACAMPSRPIRARQRHVASASAPASGRTTPRSATGSSTRSRPGQVFVNGMVASDPRLPFGGIKHSGYGRELGAYGIREFVNVKTVWIQDK